MRQRDGEVAANKEIAGGVGDNKVRPPILQTSIGIGVRMLTRLSHGFYSVVPHSHGQQAPLRVNSTGSLPPRWFEGEPDRQDSAS